MHGVFESLNSRDLAGATAEQKWRIFKAEHLRIGHLFTRAAVWAELREADGWMDEGPMAAVAPMELLDLYSRIEGVQSSSEHYAILAEPVPEKAQAMADRPLVWFDIIHGLTAPHVIKSVGQAAHELAMQNAQLWHRALDIGTGTGNQAAVLLGQTEVPRSVENLTTIDREMPLLAIASNRYPEAQHVQGDALVLPFPDASFDLITSGGLAYGLEYDDQTTFFSEVSRLLKPGGVYLDGDYCNPYSHPDFLGSGPKYDIEHSIAMHIAPTEIAPPKYWKSLSEKFGIEVKLYEPDDFPPEFGLQHSEREYRGERPNEITDVRVLSKGLADVS